MKALSIRQPWAWAIIHAGKDIENRNWATKLRARFYVHASQRFDHDGWLWIRSRFPRIHLPQPNMFDLGGIIGSADLVDCVTESSSKWFFGPYGHALRDPRPLPFRPLRGRLQFFEVK